MSCDDLSVHLQSLPPALVDRVDRFEQIQARVHRRRRRRLAAGVAVAASAAIIALVATVTLHLGTGDQPVASEPHQAVSPGVSEPGQTAPGGQAITRLSDPVTTIVTQDQTVSLGVRPAGATSIVLSLWCVKAGTLRLPGGAFLNCTTNEAVRPDARATSPNNLVPLKPGQSTLELNVTPGTEWKIVTTYVHNETTAWGINADGQTYGAANENGKPDLIAAYATNGKTGYILATDEENAGGPPPTSPAQAGRQQKADQGKTFMIPVYTADGHTVIGHFDIGPGSGTTTQPSN